MIGALIHLKPENASFGRALNVWLDKVPTDLSIGLLVLSFIVIWTAFQIIAFSSVGLHPDMLEAYAWGLHPSAGYYKHPPLSGLIAGAWFSLFPPRDWAFHLLAMTNAAAPRLGVISFLLVTARLRLRSQIAPDGGRAADPARLRISTEGSTTWLRENLHSRSGTARYHRIAGARADRAERASAASPTAEPDPGNAGAGSASAPRRDGT